jgi:single-strand DNA-binding protein
MKMFNQAVIVGRLGKSPERRQVGETAVCNFSVATSENWRGKDGNKQESTTWHNVVAWGAQAENCAKYLQKGSLVMVVGKIDNKQYDGKDGTKHFKSEIRAVTVKFLDSKPQQSQNNQEEAW